MAQIDDEIKRLIRQTVEHDDLIFQGVVTEVNEEEFTCTVRRDDQVDYFEVRLRGLIKGSLQGFAFIPRVQSVVLVAHIGYSNELFVCQFTEIDKIVFTANDMSFLLDTDKVDIKKGENIVVQIDAETLKIDNDKSNISITGDRMEIRQGDKVSINCEGNKIDIKNDKSTIEINASDITLNGGNLGGLVKIKALENNLKSLKTFVETMHKALPTAFSSILAGMTSNGALGATSYNSAMAGQMIMLENMENQKIKQ